MNLYYLGILLSVITSSLLIFSLFQDNKEKMLLFQSIETGLNLFKNLFLGGYSGTLTQGFALLRNLLGHKGKLSKQASILIIAAQLIVGIALNREGVWGFIPIFASTSYSWGLYKLRETQALRWLFISNLSLWLIYEIHLKDFPSALTSLGIITFNLIAILKNRSKAK